MSAMSSLSSSSSSSQVKGTKVLTIGVGSMGSGLTLHLASLPHYAVLAFDAWGPTLAKFKETYEKTVPEEHPSRKELLSLQNKINSPADVTSIPNFTPDVIIFMVVNSAQVTEFLFPSYIKTLPPTTTILVMSTISPSACFALREKAKATVSEPPLIIDAPVSGGPVKAGLGKLSIMLSDPSTSGSSSPSSTYVNMLNDISSNGETLFIIPKLEKNDTSLGAGSTAKAVHQLLAGVHITSCNEALSLARHVGLNLTTFYNLVLTAAGNSWMFADRGQRTILGMEGEEVPTKSAVGIFIKDLGIVLEESNGKTPLASAALKKFEQAVSMGMILEDDSQIWKVYSNDFNEVIDVSLEPRHNLRLHNDLCRAFFVNFEVGDTTLAHVHSVDSVYIFLSPSGASVDQLVKGVGCKRDFMDYGEVRFGEHCECPLEHIITSLPGAGGVTCVDAELLRPPPKRGKEEIQEMEKHELVKVRSKFRCFKIALNPGDAVETFYDFFGLRVVGKGGECDFGGWRKQVQVGDCDWFEPKGTQKVENVGETVVEYFVIQWREWE